MYNEYSDSSGLAALAAIFAALGIVLVFLAIIGIVLYIFDSIGRYTMAKNKGLNSPWMAWLPYFRDYLLGDIIGDKVAFGTFIIPYAKMILVVGPIVISVLSAATYSDNSAVGVLFTLCAIAFAVYQYGAFYRLYKLYRPDSAVVFLVLSIFFGFLIPIFTFIIRKDEPQEYLAEQPKAAPTGEQPSAGAEPQAQPEQPPVQPQPQPEQAPVQPQPQQPEQAPVQPQPQPEQPQQAPAESQDPTSSSDQ